MARGGKVDIIMGNYVNKETYEDLASMDGLLSHQELKSVSFIASVTQVKRPCRPQRALVLRFE